MSADLALEVTGEEEVLEMLAEFTGAKARNRIRSGTRAAAGVYRKAMPRRAPAKRLRKMIPARQSEHSGAPHLGPGEWGASATPINPLWVIFEKGAGPHEIGSRSRRRVLWNAGAAFVSAPPVLHPGMPARPFVTDTYQAEQGKALEAARAKILAPPKGATT